MEQLLSFEGCNFFRQRLVLATLSSRPVRITKIREGADEPGLREFEAGFIRLLDKLTNGSRIEVSETGTSIFYRPGLLTGGVWDHDCSLQRGIGYFLEPLVMMAPFAKKPLRITLRGITNSTTDPSVDYYRMCVLPLLKKFLPDKDLELKCRRRGLEPEGVGEVFFSCPVVRKMRPVQLTTEGKVKRVRGMAYCARVSPAMANRMVDSARAVLNKFLPDVYIYTDTAKGAEAGKSPGYGLVLSSESTQSVVHTVEATSNSVGLVVTRGDGVEGVRGGGEVLGETPSGPSPVLPEDIGRHTASLLIDEIVKGGYVDSGHQCVPLLFMALGSKDVSKILLGELTEYTVQFLRHLRDFFQVTFKVSCEEEEVRDGDGGGVDEVSLSRQLVTLSCIGVGYSNFSKGIK